MIIVLWRFFVSLSGLIPLWSCAVSVICLFMFLFHCANVYFGLKCVCVMQMCIHSEKIGTETQEAGFIVFCKKLQDLSANTLMSYTVLQTKKVHCKSEMDV